MTHMINIQPRKPRFDLSDVPVFWNDGDPVLTRFFDALSIHFPDGERFFIQSVRNYQDRKGHRKIQIIYSALPKTPARQVSVGHDSCL